MAKHTHRAILKSERHHAELALMKVEAGAWRWLDVASGQPFDKVDYLSDGDAIRALRVLVETDPQHVGVDLTILPVGPTASERAAAALDGGLRMDIESITAVIDRETNLPAIVKAVEELVAYEVTRMRQPKPAGLDMTHGGLLVNVVGALAKSTQQDYGNIIRVLTAGIEKVQVFKTMPTGRPQ